MKHCTVEGPRSASLNLRAPLRGLATSSVALALVACAATAPPPPARTAVPAALQPAANETLAQIVPAKGVQIYECRVVSGGGAYAWAFVAPEAELFDARGTRIGKHYAGPHWEANDGSKVVGTVKQRADAPTSGAIPWLLLDAKSVGPAGTFAKVTSIQRVNTAGGVAPAGGCSAATAGASARVGYTADYTFFLAK